ncbi:G-type lectin S-receptor-like serine/threonine-protein kinase [Cardamine amara subsp. amara]|uniref:G-type lectin S-receptor-like serine/threonine-protein kinase n=1 Tax=Cardamine amara subsp. amara TaxID=228776 RepID=A0ABD1BWU9_CARAN
MWHKQVSPRTIVWVANRDSPVQETASSCLLKISDGNLILHDNMTDRTIWSTSLSSSSSTDVQAVLLDNGNLVLRDGPTSSATLLWQSFDHLSDTWLPGAKIRFNNIKLGSQRLTSWKSSIDPSSGRYSLEVDSNTKNSLITVWNGSKSYWSSGPWDDKLRAFKKVPDHTATILSFIMNLNESFITHSVDHYSMYRLVMDVSGRFMLYIWLVEAQIWSVVWSSPTDSCAVYNYCGSFGICNETQELPPCRCVPGFKRAFRQGSDSNDFSGGCISESQLQCGNGNDKFLPIENMKLATDPTAWVSSALLVTTCASTCLADCSCKAYADNGTKCLMWTRDAFNLQQLDANKSKGHTFFLRLFSSNISIGTSNKGKTKHSKGRSIVLLKHGFRGRKGFNRL